MFASTGCRGLIRIAPSPDTTPPHSAGASARAVFGRRVLSHRRQVRTKRSDILLLGTVLGAVGLGLLAQGAKVGPFWPFLGAMLTLFAPIWILGELYDVPDHVLAWRTGAEGEERTGLELAKLEPDGFVTIHDRSIPGSRANIDHVAVGPSGVFVVETKNYRRDVRVRNSEVFVGGRRTGAAAQVRREVQAIEAIVGSELAKVGLSVSAILCIHRATLPLFRSEVAGIPIVSRQELVRVLRGGPTVLAPEQVARLATMLDRGLTVAD